MSTPSQADRILMEYASLLNRINTADLDATVQYDVMSDALIWSDEKNAEMPPQLIGSLRLVFNFRTHLIRGTKIDDMSIWDYYNSLFPQWIGFAQVRRTPTPELLELYRRGNISTRWCLRKFELETNSGQA